MGEPRTTTATHPQPTAGAGSLRRRGGRGRDIRPEAALLLRMAKTGDRDAFAELYRAFVDNVRRYVAARMRHRDPDAVADLVQDTFTTALAELDRAHDDVEGWFIQLAAKMCTRHSWGQRRYLRTALTLGEQERRRDELVPTDGSRHTRLIAQALAELDPAARLTVQLRFLDGHPRRTTAQIMACSEWTVRQAQHRALQQLAARLSATAQHDTAAQHNAR